ncbi:hypothetical protein CDAR_79741 [Caerostris darwini]|uniref:Ycf15 n=1 Tax=Caerostris darwini TaxID=1538125 RepID=A0AAV4VA72_9ARAC|nr:hypothetical protein CDAR_79741 [Caerostris darwini]
MSELSPLTTDLPADQPTSAPLGVLKWQNRWNSSSKGREVFGPFPEVKASRIQGDFFLNQLITEMELWQLFKLGVLGKHSPAIVVTPQRTETISFMNVLCGRTSERNSFPPTTSLHQQISYSSTRQPNWV